MQVLKSFFKKKTTKVYLIIITFIFLGTFCIIEINNYLSNLVKEAYSSSHLSIVMDQSQKEQLKKIKNIAIINENLILKTNYKYLNYVIIKKDNNLKDNEVILSDTFEKIDINLYESIIIDNHSFKAKEIDNKLKYNEILISSNYYNIISQDQTLREFDIILDNWLKLNITKKTLQKLPINNDFGLLENITNNNPNLNTTINLFNITFSIILIAFSVLYIIIIMNVFKDEKLFNLILNQLGFNQKKILAFNNIKSILLIVISLLFAIVLNVIIMSFLKIFHTNNNFTIIIKASLILLLITNLCNFIYLLKRRI